MGALQIKWTKAMLGREKTEFYSHTCTWKFIEKYDSRRQLKFGALPSSQETGRCLRTLLEGEMTF